MHCIPCQLSCQAGKALAIAEAETNSQKKAGAKSKAAGRTRWTMAPYWMACGRNNQECSDWELHATANITALSNFLMIPALYVAWRQVRNGIFVQHGNGTAFAEWRVPNVSRVHLFGFFVTFSSPTFEILPLQGLRWEFSFGVFGVITSSLYRNYSPPTRTLPQVPMVLTVATSPPNPWNNAS